MFDPDNMPETEDVATIDDARELAIEWQHWQAEQQSMSYGEAFAWQEYFAALAERFPELAEEFTENAII